MPAVFENSLNDIVVVGRIDGGDDSHRLAAAGAELRILEPQLGDESSPASAPDFDEVALLLLEDHDIRSRHLDELADANLLDSVESQCAERLRDGVSLGIIDGGLQRHPDPCEVVGQLLEEVARHALRRPVQVLIDKLSQLDFIEIVQVENVAPLIQQLEVDLA